MDTRIQTYLEKELGYSLASFPPTGVDLRESGRRLDEAGSRLLIVRVGQAAIGTAIPCTLRVIAPVIDKLDGSC